MQPDDRRLAARWTRREFVRGAAGMVALPHLPGVAAVPSPRFAYVASGEGSLHVFRLRGEVLDKEAARGQPALLPAFCFLR